MRTIKGTTQTEGRTMREELVDWLDDLISDAGVDKPYDMNSEDRGIYQKILDILEEYFEGELK